MCQIKHVAIESKVCSFASIMTQIGYHINANKLKKITFWCLVYCQFTTDVRALEGHSVMVLEV
jgi:hypothetical protein